MSELTEMYHAVCSLADPIARERQMAARCGQLADAIKENALMSGAMERDFVVVLTLGRERNQGWGMLIPYLR